MSSGYPLRDAAGPSQSHHPYSESESPPRQVPSPNNYSGSGSGSDSSDDDPIYFGTTGGDPGDESQPLRTVNSSRSHSRKSSRSSRTSGRSSSKGGRRGTGSGQRSAAGEEEVGVLPRLVGGSYKTVDGIHRGGSSEIGLGNIVKEPSAREKRRAYWRAAVVNLALIASWCEYGGFVSRPPAMVAALLEQGGASC